MPLQLPNRFTSYSLTAEEIIIGSTFNELQVCVIQNELSAAAHSKMNMKYDGTDKAILQEEAELQGKINAFTWLLSQHEEAQKEHMKLKIAAVEQQKE